MTNMIPAMTQKVVEQPEDEDLFGCEVAGLW